MIPEYIVYDGEKYYVTDMDENAFMGSNITSITFDSDCRITVIRSFSFKDCKSLKSIVLPAKLEEIKCQSFYGCSVLEAVYLPDTLKIIGRREDGSIGGRYPNSNVKDGAFALCSKLYFVNELGETEKPDVWYAPTSLEEISGEAFKEINTINRVMVFGENFHRFYRGYAIAHKDAKFDRVFVFKGDFTREGSVFQLACEMKRMDIYFTHPNVKDRDFLTYDDYYRKNTPNAVIHFCSSGIAYSLANTKSDGDVVYTSVEGGTKHFVENKNVAVTYNNYFENGSYMDACYCGHKIVQAESKAPALFEHRGYSVPENGDRGYFVTQGIKVDREMLALLGEDVDFGVVVSVNVNGTSYKPLESGATSLSLIDSEYSFFDIKISDIPSAYIDTAIVFCGYIRVGESVSYLDGGATYTEVVGISYNAIFNGGKEENV